METVLHNGYLLCVGSLCGVGALILLAVVYACMRLSGEISQSRGE